MSIDDWGTVDDQQEPEPYVTVAKTIAGDWWEVQDAFREAIEASADYANAVIAVTSGTIHIVVGETFPDSYTATFTSDGRSRTIVTVQASTEGPMAGALSQYTHEKLTALLGGVAERFSGRSLG